MKESDTNGKENRLVAEAEMKQMNSYKMFGGNLMLVPYTRKNHTVSMYNPFHDLDELERRFFSDNSIGEFKTDIRDNGNEYILEADLPGFRKEDIHVDLDDNTLTITAERHSDYEEKDKKGNYIRCERSYGSFSRSFDTSGIDTTNIKAAYDNGILKLTLPKVTEVQPTSRRLLIE